MTATRSSGGRAAREPGQVLTRWFWRVAVVGGFLIICFVAGIVLVNVVMGRLVGQGDVVEVPSIEGLALAEARAELGRHDLRLEEEGRTFSAVHPPESVVSQRPRAGSRVKRDRPIRVTVSEGMELATVPALRGVSVSDVHLLLAADGLAQGAVSHARAEGVPGGAIITSAPRPGEKVPRGTEVSLLVSDGPRATSFVMPDLVGRDERHVTEWLLRNNLEPRVAKMIGRGRQSGTVFDQRPPAGARVTEGDLVELKVAR